MFDAVVCFAILGGFVIGFLVGVYCVASTEAKNVANGFVTVGYRVYKVEEIDLKEEGQNEVL